ncbi:DUF805 domain-containing protein [Aureitalea marina]|uniref:DUF805 domain-containing protein n=1 Tax=Aureitalea marina TaxID=930804 RepID=A0A2S7KRR4_9FLAO|nr:DUF805 domain-containing protein [Aureitalea marina]PQB05297.1 hypothetical protein BST85_10685 [Aureitalea marina]
MFLNPFSFKGRIRRLEYGLSYLIYLVIFYGSGAVLVENDDFGIVYLIIVVPLLWFLFAQGAKRCHDLGESGFFQLIPFYVLWMVFADGKSRPNKWGHNPKHIEGGVHSDFLQLRVRLPEKTPLTLLIEGLPFVLLNVFLGLLMDHLMGYEIMAGVYGIGYAVITFLSYYLLLVFCFKGREIQSIRPFLFRHRLIYAVAVYILIRIYRVIFHEEIFGYGSWIVDVALVIGIWMSTYISILIYPLTNKKNQLNE